MRRHVSRTTGRDRERGAIMVLAAASLTVLVFAAALAVDTGGRAEERRTDQKVADMAALDSVRGLLTYPDGSRSQILAAESATRNTFTDNQCGTLLEAKNGRFDTATDTFSEGATPFNAVDVRLCSKYRDFFGGGQPQLNGYAIAMLQAEGQLAIGSTLLTAGTAGCPSTPPTLNPPLPPIDGVCSLLNDLLANLGASTGISAVGYQGLLNTNVSLSKLETAIAGNVLSPTQLAATKVSMAQVAQAETDLLDQTGESYAELNVLQHQVVNQPVDEQQNIPLTDILGVNVGNGSAAGVTVNLANFLVGGAELANGNAGLSVPLTTLTLPGFGTFTVSLTAIQPAKASLLGPPGPGTHADDSQVTMDMTVQSSVLSTYNLTLPVAIKVGGASAWLKSVDPSPCTGTPTSLTTPTTFKDVTATITNGQVDSLASIPLATVNGGIDIPSSPASPDPVLVYTTNFLDTTHAKALGIQGGLPTTNTPPAGNTAYTAGSTLGSPTNTLSVSLLPGVLTLPTTVAALISAIQSDIYGASSSLIEQLFLAIGSLLSSALPMHVGSADLWGLQATCGMPTLVQ